MRKYVEYPPRGEEDNETEFVFDDPIAHLSARLDPVWPVLLQERTNRRLHLDRRCNRDREARRDGGEKK